MAIAILFLLSSLGVCSTTLVDFENLPNLGWQPGGAVYDQYIDFGIIFASKPIGIDFSKQGMPGFPHSGSIAAESYNPNGITIIFPQPVSRVKVWLGYDTKKGKIACDGTNYVEMIASGIKGNEFTWCWEPLSCGPQSIDFSNIRVPLELISTRTEYSIAEVKIRIINGFDHPITLESDGLAIDDIEFNTISPAPSPAAVAGGGFGSAYTPPGYIPIYNGRNAATGQPVQGPHENKA